MTGFIKNVAYIVVTLFVAIVASMYTHYFIGMAVSLFAQKVLGADGVAIATYFAWIGVVMPVLVLSIISAYAMIEARDAKQIEVDGEALDRLFKEIDRGGD